MRDLTFARGPWSHGEPATAETEREVRALRSRQIRAQVARRRAEEALARVNNSPLSRSARQQILARAKAIVELSRAEREEWHRQQRLKRWQKVKAKARAALRR